MTKSRVEAAKEADYTGDKSRKCVQNGGQSGQLLKLFLMETRRGW